MDLFSLIQDINRKEEPNEGQPNKVENQINAKDTYDFTIKFY